ncbi:MAG: hypothetical protein WC679_13875 [Bacteroidales bacterium]|jgi:hypothetical protein
MWLFKKRNDLSTSEGIIKDIEKRARSLNDRQLFLDLKEKQYNLKLENDINERVLEYRERNAELKIQLAIAEEKVMRYAVDLSSAKESVNNLLQLYVRLVEDIKRNEYVKNNNQGENSQSQELKNGNL